MFNLDAPKPITKELAETAKTRSLTTEDAKKALKDAGIADPLELTEVQFQAAMRTKERRKARTLPTFDDIVKEAMLRVTRDFSAQQTFREETAKMKERKSFEAIAVRPTTAAALIRRQKHNIMLEQGTSTTSTYIQATGFLISSATCAMMTVLSLLLGAYTHKIIWGAAPMSALVAWRSWEGYESVAEDLRFLNQAKEMRAVKRAHIPEPEYLGNLVDKDAKSPLERKREKRRQQEADAQDALERKKAAEEMIAAEKKRNEEEAAAAAAAAAGAGPATSSRSAAPESTAARRNRDVIFPSRPVEDDDTDVVPVRNAAQEKKKAADEAKLKAAAERAKALAVS
jgi:hypothetical protein